jgi:hypothetical protein
LGGFRLSDRIALFRWLARAAMFLGRHAIALLARGRYIPLAAGLSFAGAIGLSAIEPDRHYRLLGAAREAMPKATDITERELKHVATVAWHWSPREEKEEAVLAPERLVGSTLWHGCPKGFFLEKPTPDDKVDPPTAANYCQPRRRVVARTGGPPTQVDIRTEKIEIHGPGPDHPPVIEIPGAIIHTDRVGLNVSQADIQVSHASVNTVGIEGSVAVSVENSVTVNTPSVTVTGGPASTDQWLGSLVFGFGCPKITGTECQADPHDQFQGSPSKTAIAVIAQRIAKRISASRPLVALLAYADEPGDKELNERLAQQRGDHLAAKLGVDPKKMRVIPCGKQTDDDKPQDPNWRRVDIALFDREPTKSDCNAPGDAGKK